MQKTFSAQLFAMQLGNHLWVVTPHNQQKNPVTSTCCDNNFIKAWWKAPSIYETALTQVPVVRVQGRENMYEGNHEQGGMSAEQL